MTNRVRTLRQQRARTAASVARDVGVTEKTILAWEAGRATPTARHARKLARVLGVELEELGLGASPERAAGPSEGPASSSD